MGAVRAAIAERMVRTGEALVLQPEIVIFIVDG
jgi:hypothetical protein